MKKNTIKLTVFAVIIAIVFAMAIAMATIGNEIAHASIVESTDVKVEVLEEDGSISESYLAIPREDITLKITIDTTRENKLWYCADLCVYPLIIDVTTGDKAKNSEQIGFFYNARLISCSLTGVNPLVGYSDTHGLKLGFSLMSQSVSTNETIEIIVALQTSEVAEGVVFFGLRTNNRENEVTTVDADGKFSNQITDSGCDTLTNSQLASIEMCQKNLSINNRVQIDGQQAVRQYAFLYEEFEEEDGDLYSYRRTYQEKGYTHGVDDVSFERIVLGQIDSDTSIMNFLQAFGEKERRKLVLINECGSVVYDCGQPGEGMTESDLYDVDMYTVGTGWQLKYGEQTIYLSVLGDLNGDGLINYNDSMLLNNYANERLNILDTSTEVRLAAYLANMGMLNYKDLTYMQGLLGEMYINKDFFTIVEEE